MDPKCLFCKIIAGEIPGRKVYEDDKFIAFLDLFPVRKGQVWIASKEHYSSNFTKVDSELAQEIIVVAQKIAKHLEEKLTDVERTIFVWEGLGVNHLHVKLYPNRHEDEHGLTQSGPQAAENELAELQQLLKAEQN
jgi:histidine triad (HIT) family protein